MGVVAQLTPATVIAGAVTLLKLLPLSSLYFFLFVADSPVFVLRDAGLNFMAIHPRYNLLTNNCQNLVESLVKLLCDGKVISQPMLNEELSLLSPKIARDLMVARLRSKLDASNEDEEREDVKEDADIIKTWFHKIHH